MYSVQPGEIPVKKFYGLLASSVGPRPIALASTVNAEGQPNLAPFSCFNFFGSNPPLLVFSPMRRIADGETKHTLHNIEATKEVVINVVNYNMVQQTSLASMSFEEGVNEFKKAGLTMLDSDLVNPKRVAESPVQYECKVREIIQVGQDGGAANLILCEVIKMHISEEVLFANQKIDQEKLDQVGRLGGSSYTRAKRGMFEVPKPTDNIGMGVDQLPEHIRCSAVLTGNNLAQLANLPNQPQHEKVEHYIEQHKLSAVIAEQTITENHRLAQDLLHQHKTEEAWYILLAKTVKTL